MKRQKLTMSKSCATVLSLLLAFHPVFAQAQTPQITVTTFRDLVRFAGPSEVQELRVEVFSSIGEKIFDSNSVAGQTQDWFLQDLQGKSVESGLYVYAITVKDQTGIKQIQRGNVIVARERQGLEAARLINHSEAGQSETIQPQPSASWDVDQAKNPDVVNTRAIGLATQNPLTRLYLGAGGAEPVTKGSRLLMEAGAPSSAAKGLTPPSIDGNWSLRGNAGTNQNDAPNFLATTDPQPLILKTNGLEAMHIDPKDNVSLATTMPGQDLDVNGNIKMSGVRTKLFYRGDVDSHIGSLAFYSPDGGNTAIITPYNSTGGNLANSTVRFGGFGSFESNTVNLNVSGNVGIGTPTPGQRLDVNGNIKMSGVRTKLFYRGDVDTHIGSLALYSPDGGNTAIITPYNSTGGNIANSTIRFGGFGSFESNTVNLNVSGNVGIGTTNPQAKLDVTGTGGVRARVNSDVNSGLSLSLQGSPEWSVASVVHGGPEFPSRDFVIHSDRLGKDILGISQFGTIFANAPLGVSGSLSLQSNRTVISGFDDPVTLTGFHWFGPAPDSDLAFGIKRLGVNKYEFHFNGPIFKRGGGVSFVEDHPTDPSKEIVYVALEGPENGTYTRGAAQLVNGVAVVDLPDHFSMVTNDEGLTIQLTPKGTWLRLYAAEVNAKQIVVREEGEKSGNFDYLVQGVRKGYEKHQVIRDK